MEHELDAHSCAGGNRRLGTTFFAFSLPLHREFCREIQDSVVAGPGGVLFLENRQFRGCPEECDRVNSVRDCATQDVFTRFQRQERELQSKPDFAGVLLP
jgi:hypothetical protein